MSKPAVQFAPFKNLSARKRGAAVEFLTRLTDKATQTGAIRISPLTQGGTVKFHHLKEWCTHHDCEATQQGDVIVIAKIIPQESLIDALAETLVS